LGFGISDIRNGTPAQLLHEVERGRLTLVYSPRLKPNIGKCFFGQSSTSTRIFWLTFFARLEEDGSA
jgi:hypothetical protein